MSDTEPKSLKISRRGALISMAHSLGGLALTTTPKFIRELGEESEPAPTVETEDAKYFAFYESHQVGTDPELIIKTKPNIFFHELFMRSEELINQEPLDTFFTMNTFGTLALPGEIERYLYQNNGKVVYEGISIPPKQENIQRYANILILGGASAINISELVRSMKNRIMDKKNTGISASTRLALSSLLAFWTSSDFISSAATLSVYNKAPQKSERLKKIATRVKSYVSFTHPENVTVFLRNILMSRKLMLLAKNNNKYNIEKIRIAYQVGAGHAAVQDLIELGDDISLAFLDIYPKGLLNAVVEHNGGTKPFCSTQIIKVKEAIHGTPSTETVIDEKLKSYLEERIGKDNTVSQ